MEQSVSQDAGALNLDTGLLCYWWMGYSLERVYWVLEEVWDRIKED